MAAYTEYQGTPWLASINQLLTKTQENLKKSRQLSQSRCKSFFLNSSELLSTNYSLEKSDHIEFEVETFKKEFKLDLEQGLEDISEGISNSHYRLKSLEIKSNIARKIKEDTICELENTELRIKKSISKVKNKQYCNEAELNLMKSKIFQDAQEKFLSLKENLETVPKGQMLEKRLVEIPEFSKEFLKKSKFLRYCNRKQEDIRQNLEETGKRLKKNCRRSLRRLDGRGKEMDGLNIESLSSKSSSFLYRQSPSSYSLASELEKIKQKSSVYSKISEKIENCSEILTNHQLSSVKSRICSEISDICYKELQVNTLLNRLNQLEINKNIKKNRVVRRGIGSEPKQFDNFTRININYMGESDEDSLSFTSPTPSPLNYRLNSVNSTKHSNKNFMFFGDTIHENPDEYERFSPELN